MVIYFNSMYFYNGAFVISSSNKSLVLLIYIFSCSLYMLTLTEENETGIVCFASIFIVLCL